MSNDRQLELIHAEIDRTLGSKDRVELNQLLLADPELRRQRDQLARTCAILDAVEPVAVPEGLSQALMQRIEQSPAIPVPARRPSAWQQLLQPALMRYAAAFGGGIVVAAVAFGTGAGHAPGQDMASFAGTMASPTAPASAPSEELRVVNEQLSGMARIRHTDGGDLTMLEFQLQSPAPVEVVAEFNGESLHFQRAGGQDGHFGLVLSEPTSEVKVSFVVSGEVVHQGVLRSPGEG